MKKLYAISLPVIVLCSLFLPSINRAGVLGMLRPMALGGTSSAERNAKEAGSDLAKLNRRVVALAKTLNDDGLLADEEIRGKLAGIRDADAKYKKRSAADQGKDKSGKVVDTKVDAGSTSYFLATARRPTEIQNVIDLPTILDKYKKQRQALAKRTWSLKSGRLGRHFLGRDDKLDDIAQDIEDKATDLQKHNLLDITSEITKDDDAGVNINDIRTACTNLKNHLSEVNKYYGSVIGTVCQLKRKLEVDSDDDDAADNIPEPSAPPADDKNSDLAKKKAKKQNGSAGRRTKSYLKQMYKVVKEFAAEESEKDRGKKTRLNDAMLATACAQFDGWYKSLSTRFSAENKSKAKDDLSFMPSDTSVSSPLDLAIDSDDAVFPTSGTPQMKVKDIPTAYAQLKRDIHTQDQLIKAIANQEYLFDDLEHGWANNLRSHIAAYLDRAILGGFSIIAARIAMRKMMGGSKTLVSGTVGVGTKTVDVRGIAECTKDLLKALGFSDGESGANTNGSSEVIPDCSTFFATEMPNLNNGKNIPNAINRCIFYRGNNEADDSSPNASTSDDSWATPDSTRIQAAIVTARNNLSQDKRAKLTDICIKIRTSLSTLYGRYFKLINENQIIGLHLVDGKIHAADTLARKELGLTKIALYNLLALMALARGHNSYGKVLHDKVTGVPSTLQGLLRAIDPEAGFNKYQSTFVDANGGAKMHAANKTAAQRLEYVTYTVGAAENTAHIKVENYKVLKNNNTDVDTLLTAAQAAVAALLNAVILSLADSKHVLPDLKEACSAKSLDFSKIAPTQPQVAVIFHGDTTTGDIFTQNLEILKTSRDRGEIVAATSALIGALQTRMRKRIGSGSKAQRCELKPALKGPSGDIDNVTVKKADGSTMHFIVTNIWRPSTDETCLKYCVRFADGSWCLAAAPSARPDSDKNIDIILQDESLNDKEASYNMVIYADRPGTYPMINPFKITKGTITTVTVKDDKGPVEGITSIGMANDGTFKNYCVCLNSGKFSTATWTSGTLYEEDIIIKLQGDPLDDAPYGYPIFCYGGSDSENLDESACPIETFAGTATDSDQQRTINPKAIFTFKQSVKADQATPCTTHVGYWYKPTSSAQPEQRCSPVTTIDGGDATAALTKQSTITFQIGKKSGISNNDLNNESKYCSVLDGPADEGTPPEDEYLVITSSTDAAPVINPMMLAGSPVRVIDAARRTSNPLLGALPTPRPSRSANKVVLVAKVRNTSTIPATTTVIQPKNVKELWRLVSPQEGLERYVLVYRNNGTLQAVPATLQPLKQDAPKTAIITRGKTILQDQAAFKLYENTDFKAEDGDTDPEFVNQQRARAATSDDASVTASMPESSDSTSVGSNNGDDDVVADDPAVAETDAFTPPPSTPETNAAAKVLQKYAKGGLARKSFKPFKQTKQVPGQQGTSYQVDSDTWKKAYNTGPEGIIQWINDGITDIYSIGADYYVTYQGKVWATTVNDTTQGNIWFDLTGAPASTEPYKWERTNRVKPGFRYRFTSGTAPVLATDDAPAPIPDDTVAPAVVVADRNVPGFPDRQLHEDGYYYYNIGEGFYVIQNVSDSKPVNNASDIYQENSNGWVGYVIVNGLMYAGTFANDNQTINIDLGHERRPVTTWINDEQNPPKAGFEHVFPIGSHDIFPGRKLTASGGHMWFHYVVNQNPEEWYFLIDSKKRLPINTATKIMHDNGDTYYALIDKKLYHSTSFDAQAKMITIDLDAEDTTDQQTLRKIFPSS